MKTPLPSIRGIPALTTFNANLIAGSNTRVPDDAAHGGGDNSGTNNFGEGSGIGSNGETTTGTGAGGASGVGNIGGHHRGDTNEIEGSEAFREHLVLAPTNNAPLAASATRGSADIDQENQGGTVLYRVEIRAFGLPAGTNQVTAVLSDGSTVALGDLVASNGRFAAADELLPSGVNAADITQIIISD